MSRGANPDDFALLTVHCRLLQRRCPDRDVIGQAARPCPGIMPMALARNAVESAALRET
jgi:hypothetical protein